MYRVFFAEDESYVRDLIINTINWTELGLEVCGSAGNGRDALNSLLTGPADILITDIKMSFIDGIELSRLVLQNNPETRVIILSGYSDFEYMQEAIHLGVCDYILKPVTPLKLTQALLRASASLGKSRDKLLTDRIMTENRKNDSNPDLPWLIEEAAVTSPDRNAILSFLRTGSENGIKCFAEQLIEENYTATSKLPSMYFIYDVIATAAQSAREMGLELSFLKDYTNAAEQFENKEGFVKLISELFGRIINMRNGLSDSKTRITREARKYIESNYANENLTLGEVASKIGITPNYLSSIFGKDDGENFSEYLNRIRIQKAAQLLKSSSMSIDNIAHEVGYSDSFYFSKVFRKLIGITPREYRKMQTVRKLHYTINEKTSLQKSVRYSINYKKIHI